MTDPKHKFTLKVRDIEASAVGRPAVQLMRRVVDLLRFVAVVLAAALPIYAAGKVYGFW